MIQIPPIMADGRGGLITGVVGVSLLQAAALAAAALATRDLFASLHSGGQAPVTALVILISAGLCTAMARLVERTLAEWLGQNYAISLREALYRQLAGHCQSRIAEQRIGALGLRFVGDLSAARNWVGLGITRVISALIIIPAAACALWLLNETLARQAMVPLAVCLSATMVLAVLIERLHRRLRSKRARIAVDMIERVVAAPELDLMGRTSSEVKRLARNGHELKQRATWRRAMTSTLVAIPEMGVALAGATILFHAYAVDASAAEVAGMLAVLAILAMPIRESASVWDRRCAWRVAREKLLAVMSRAQHSGRQNTDTDSDTDCGAIRFDNVEFRNLRLNTVFQPGEKIRLDGVPGSGKSSLMSLLANLEVPDAGQIRYGQGNGRPSVHYLHSSSPILRGSLRRAATLGLSPRPDDRLVIDGLGRVGLTPLLERLGGLDGRIVESGRSLSTSERLRLLLVRALLSNASLLLLDLPPSDDPIVNKICRQLLRRPGTTLFISGTCLEKALFDRCMTLGSNSDELLSSEALAASVG